MASERSMEALHNKLKIVYSYVNGLPNYNPVNPLITAVNIKAVIDRITEINTNLVTPEQNLAARRLTLNDLIDATFGKDGHQGLLALMRDSTGYVETMGEAHKSDAKLLRKIVNQLQPKAKAVKNSNEEGGNNPAPEKKRSTAETGIGSVIKKTEDFIKVLENNSSYAPTDSSITTNSLQTILNQIKTTANDINDLLKVVTPLRSERNKLVHDKKEGILRIISQVKKYIKTNFGENSSEWNGIKNIEP